MTRVRVGDERAHLRDVEVQRVGTDIGEYQACAAQRERVRGRDERERGHDDLVAGPDVERESGQFERVGARGGEQRPGNAERVFEAALARVGGVTVAVPVVAGQHPLDVRELVAGLVRAEKRDPDRPAGGVAPCHSHPSRELVPSPGRPLICGFAAGGCRGARRRPATTITAWLRAPTPTRHDFGR